MSTLCRDAQLEPPVDLHENANLEYEHLCAFIDESDPVCDGLRRILRDFSDNFSFDNVQAIQGVLVILEAADEESAARKEHLQDTYGYI